jgi:signal transduction histidine kinase
VPKGFDDAVRLLESEDPRLFLPRGDPVHDQDGAIVAATVLLQDVTRLNGFNELRNDLLLTTAYQFRTPLTSVPMAVHLCLEGAGGALSDKQRKLLEAAREECEHLHVTVNEMLDLARLQSDALELDRKEIFAKDLLSRCLRSYRGNGTARAVAVRVEPVSERLGVWADPESAWLVFSNLMENALRHTPAGRTDFARGVHTHKDVGVSGGSGDGVDTERRRGRQERDRAREFLGASEGCQGRCPRDECDAEAR